MGSVISCDNVWVRYNGNDVLEGINLQVREKEILSIVGPNGGGKSTLLKTIMGFKENYRGSISVLGKAPKKIKSKGLIGYLPQDAHYSLHFPVNVFDVVAMSRFSRKYIFERLDHKDKEIIFSSLEKVEMQDHRKVYFGDLSGGQRQRVLIARALARRPRILVLDEPSTGLDMVAQDGFYHMLQELRDREDLTIVMVSHDIGSVSGTVDRIACLKKKIHFHGRADECISSEEMEQVFGRDVYFLRHDPNCATCRDEK